MSKRNDTQAIRVQRHVAMRVGKRRTLDTDTSLGRMLNDLERTKACIRAKVEHPFRVIKRQFGHVKVRYRGLMKTPQQLFTLYNLWVVRHRLLNRAG